MKNSKIFNITILTSLFFLSACSTRQTKLTETSAKSAVSVYNIMGITEEENTLMPLNSFAENRVQPIIQQTIHPMQTIEPMPVMQTVATPPIPVQDITYISYAKPHSGLDYRKQKRNKVLDNIELNAKKFLGVPYVWGATGPNKFDCSGFTQWVYRDSGINIPRVSRDQARVGQFVRYENLQRGDMIFFNTTKKPNGKVTHVGIYLGNGDFIHASSAGKSVVIYNFNDKPYYKKRFLWGRRVIQPELYYASK